MSINFKCTISCIFINVSICADNMKKKKDLTGTKRFFFILIIVTYYNLFVIYLCRTTGYLWRFGDYLINLQEPFSLESTMVLKCKIHKKNMQIHKRKQIQKRGNTNTKGKTEKLGSCSDRDCSWQTYPTVSLTPWSAISMYFQMCFPFYVCIFSFWVCVFLCVLHFSATV